MTVKSRLEQTIAQAESLSGQLKTHAMETQQQEVKEMYNKMASQMEEMIPHLQGRLGHVKDEEPQFR